MNSNRGPLLILLVGLLGALLLGASLACCGGCVILFSLRSSSSQRGNDQTASPTQEASRGENSSSSSQNDRMASAPPDPAADGPKSAEVDNYALNLHGAEFLRSHLLQLLTFKDEKSFEFWGFSQRGPYNKWLTDVQAEHRIRDYASEVDVAIGHLLNLGLEYLRSDGKETEYSRFAVNYIEGVIRKFLPAELWEGAAPGGECWWDVYASS